MSTASRDPRTPTSARKPLDPQRTPTRLQPLPALFSNLSYSQLRRRNSWEDDIEPVTDLPDPRSEDSLAYCDIWTGALAQTCHDANAHFFALMRAEFQQQPAEYARLLAAFRQKNNKGRNDIDGILSEISLLFVGHSELARAFNHCMPPGYRIEATDEYVAVFVPGGGWKQYPTGLRMHHADIYPSH
ncbi:hypothetical protein BD311DRAFT_268774 [Dichomitus squalens]|uniref:Uncharacterized protein n=1 Tax=Dichomitus squalens TaxID=114155 RepID=A0A4Q9MSY2_9APHY|nr:hypothetical protein BD311DRAFT_268774 [Dichomitus squalens]